MRQSARVDRCFLTCLLLLTALAMPVGAQGRERPCGIDRFPAPTLCARAGLDTLHATYVVLLDESGSMAGRWGEVKAALGTFVRAVPEGDVLDVRLFADGVRRLNVPAPASQRLVAEWARQVESLPAPSGAYTDLGTALDQALDVIAAAPADRQHFVYILTDGAQDPPPGSLYPPSGSGNWPKLRAKAYTLGGARPLSFAILRLSNQADAQRLLAEALPHPDVVPAMTSAELRRWFESETRSIARRKLQLRLASERHGPALLDSGSSPLRLGTAVAVRRLQLRSTTDAVVVDSMPITLPNGARVVVHPSGDAGTARITSGPPTRPWYLPPARLAGVLDTTVPVLVRYEPATELRLIGDTAGPVQDSLRVVLPIVGAGLMQLAGWWTVAIGAFVALLWLVRHAATPPPRLTGKLQVEREGEIIETVELTPLRTRTYCIVAPSKRTVATLEARKAGRGTALWVVPHREPLTLGGHPLRAPERVRSPICLEHREATFHYFPS